MNPNWKRMIISTLLEDIAHSQAVNSNYTLALILTIGGHDYGPSSPLPLKLDSSACCGLQISHRLVIDSYSAFHRVFLSGLRDSQTDLWT